MIMNKLGIFMNFWEKKWDADHIKYINKAADIGFDILEFQAQPLLEMTDSRLGEIKSVADSRGIELTYSLGLDKKYDISSTDESIRTSGIKYLLDIMKQVSKMDGKIISGVSYAGWGAPEGTLEDKTPMLEASIKSMRELVKVSEQLGITYCVEAVNRFEGALLNTSKEAVEYVKMVDSPAIGVLLDTYHMNIEENNIGDAIRFAGRYLKGFHTGENNRVVPGKGHLDWDEIFKALKDVDYKGNIVSEPFVLMGGEVGSSIKVWRNLVDDCSEQSLDREAKFLLDFEKDMMKKWGMV